VALVDGGLLAPLPEFANFLKRLSYDGLVSLYSECKGGRIVRRLEFRRAPCREEACACLLIRRYCHSVKKE
jgi:hypothetical protein